MSHFLKLKKFKFNFFCSQPQLLLKTYIFLVKGTNIRVFKHSIEDTIE